MNGSKKGTKCRKRIGIKYPNADRSLRIGVVCFTQSQPFGIYGEMAAAVEEIGMDCSQI